MGLNVNDSPPRQRSSTTIRHERGTLEVQEEEGSQTFDLSNYDYHKIITTDYHMIVEVNFASHVFLPKTKQIFFSSMDERKAFLAELKQSMEGRRGTSYANQVETFLVQQFDMWTSASTQGSPGFPRIPRIPGINRALTVPKEKIVAFVSRARIDRDVNIRDLGNACNFQGWKKLYNRMIRLKSSEFLVTVFENYSIWRGEGVPREMTREGVREFLQPPGSLGHQNESNVAEDDLTNMIQVQCAFTLVANFKSHSVPVVHNILLQSDALGPWVPCFSEALSWRDG